MKRLLLIAIVATLATAKPGLYKEKEDFQFARSSTDEGSKSGFYGAQRGNMGGNYERAHNMDGLAQHQMGGLVKQVEGELGDGSKTRTGSVFTAANSRGVFGSGHYDLSNLEGRNFQEGVSYGDSQSQSQSQSQSHSSMTAQAGYNAQASALNSAAYNSRQSSRSQTGYNGYQYLGHNGAESTLQQSENLNAANLYGNGEHEASGYYSQSAYNSRNGYDQSNSNQHSENSYGSNAQSRLVSAKPVTFVLRPGTSVAIPITGQTYDSSNNAAAYDQKSVNSEAELLSNQNNHNGYRPNGPKHYESSYSYRKEWEKHDTKPVTVLPVIDPTVNPFPKNSELYEDAQSLSAGQQYESSGVGAQRSQSHSSNSYGAYNANLNSASSIRSHDQSVYNAQQHRSASATDANASSQGTYNSGVGLDTTNQIEDVNSKPKSYHSSYSYHKSWERQGDPYVIKPASGGYDTQASQRLTSASTKQGAWSSHRYGSRSQQANQNVLNLEDCNENGHVRVARSYNSNQHDEQNQYNYDQEALVQQSQNLEDLTQQTQNKWDRIEDLGQQTQDKWAQAEDLGQQTQSQWDKPQDAGQQTRTQWDKLEDAGQQTQNKWDKIEDLGQQTQTQWDKLEDAGQQTQSKWDNFDGQQTRLNVGQQLQNSWSQLESGSFADGGQETQTNWDNLNISKQDTASENVSPNNKQTQHPLETVSHKLFDTVPFPPREHSENSKKQSTDDVETGESNIFSLHEVISPKEQPVQSSTMKYGNIPEIPQNPWNVNVDSNKHWEQSENGNSRRPAYNDFNHPWYNLPSYRPQDSEQSLSNNYNNQQSHAHNAWGSHWSSFSGSDSQNSRQEDSSTLWNLWNKVDTIEKHTISSNISTEESQHPHNDPILEQTSSDDYNLTPTVQNKPFIHQYGHNTWEPRDYSEETSTPSTTSTTKYYKQTQDRKLQPSDVGRGDIGPEDTIRDITPQFNTGTQEVFNDFETKSKDDVFISTTDHKRYKTPEEIEALSQVLVNNNTISNSTEKAKEKDHYFFVVSNATSHAITDKENANKLSSNYVGTFTDLGDQSKDISQESVASPNNVDKEKFVYSTQSTEGQYLPYGQQSSVHFGHHSQNQQFVNFVQPSETFHVQNLNTPKQDASSETLSPHNEQSQNPLLRESHKRTDIDASREQNDNDKKPIHNVETGKINILITDGSVPARNQPGTNSTVNIENIPERPLPNPWKDNMDTPVNNNKRYWESFDNGHNPTSPYNVLNYYPWLNQLPHSPQNNNQTQHNNNNDQQLSLGQQNEKFDQQNTDQQFESFVQPSKMFHVQNLNTPKQDTSSEIVSPHSEQSQNPLESESHKRTDTYTIDTDQPNTDQLFESFGQHSENFDQQNTDQRFETFDQKIGKEQLPTGQQFESFGQQSENFDQQNTDQQFESFDQTIGKEQLPTEQFETLGQQSENFGQQNTDQGYESFDQKIGKEQLPIEQQFQSFGQQSENFGQQNTDQQFESFDQTIGNEPLPTEQQFETFGQQVDKFDTHDSEQDLLSLRTQKENINKEAKNTSQHSGAGQQQMEHLNLNNESPAEPKHNIQNFGTNNEKNLHSSYNEFAQQSEILDGSKWDDGEDIGQQVQNKNAHETQHLEVIPVDKPIFKTDIPEDRAQKSQIVDSKDPTKPSITSTAGPPETDKEKPGFWNSVGNKFSNAKEKVFSWFSSSS